MSDEPIEILLCVNRRINGNSCSERGSETLFTLVEQAMQQHHPDVAVKKFPCFGLCNWGPNLRIAPGGEFFHQFDDSKLTPLIEAVTAFKQSKTSAG